jgi:hypothetical protein
MPLIQTFETSRSDLKPAPIDPTWILEGAPVARSVVLSASPDGTLTAGLWDCTAGKFRWIYRVDETVTILEGEARVTDSTGTRILRAGSVAYFPRGLEAVWEVPHYVKKTFTLRCFRRAPRAVMWSNGTRFVFGPRT